MKDKSTRIHSLSLIAGAILITASVASAADQSFNIKLPVTKEDPLITFVWSFVSEYMAWSIQSTTQTLLQMRTAYGLTGIFEWPFIGAFLTSGYLLINGHIGALLFMIQNSAVFTAIGTWIMRMVLKLIAPKFLQRIPLLYDFTAIVLAALLAIALASVLAMFM